MNRVASGGTIGASFAFVEMDTRLHAIIGRMNSLKDWSDGQKGPEGSHHAEMGRMVDRVMSYLSKQQLDVYCELQEAPAKSLGDLAIKAQALLALLPAPQSEADFASEFARALCEDLLRLLVPLDQKQSA